MLTLRNSQFWISRHTFTYKHTEWRVYYRPEVRIRKKKKFNWRTKLKWVWWSKWQVLLLHPTHLKCKLCLVSLLLSLAHFRLELIWIYDKLTGICLPLVCSKICASLFVAKPLVPNNNFNNLALKWRGKQKRSFVCVCIARERKDWFESTNWINLSLYKKAYIIYLSSLLHLYWS